MLNIGKDMDGAKGTRTLMEWGKLAHIILAGKVGHVPIL